MKTNPNEPAFPGEYIDGGITKREFFAAMALQGLLANGQYDMDAEEDAITAVASADALIEALNKSE